jgi:hypothetical protein
LAGASGCRLFIAARNVITRCRKGLVRRAVDAAPPPEVDLRAADKTKLLTRFGSLARQYIFVLKCSRSCLMLALLSDARALV